MAAAVADEKTKEEKKERRNSNWSELPDDLLHLISDGFEFPALLRLRSVCHSWRRALPSPNSSTRPSLWALIPQNLQGSRDTPFLTPEMLGRSRGAPLLDSALFLSLSENRSYRIPLPRAAAAGCTCIGSGHGWLVLADAASSDAVSLSLVNPATGALVPLPPFRIVCDRSIFRSSGGLGLSVNATKSVLSSSPTDGGSSECTVLLLQRVSSSQEMEGTSQVAYARLGDSDWTVLDHRDFGTVMDVAFHRRQIYMLSEGGDVLSCDFSWRVPLKQLVAVRPPAQPPQFGSLVSTPWGDLLNVIEGISLFDPDPVTVTKLDFEKKEFVPVDSGCLEEHALFLGVNTSLCLSLDFPRLQKNCIYFMGRLFFSIFDPYGVTCHRRIYRLKDEGLEDLDPELLSWLPPICFIPTLN